MALYLGYYRPVPAYLQEVWTRARSGDRTPDAAFGRLVTALPQQLPAGCRLLGSYAAIGGEGLGTPSPPSVMLVESDSTEALAFISQYYTGYLQFQWVPARAVGASSTEREAFLEVNMAALADLQDGLP